MVNHTIAHLTDAVSPLCLPYDFKQQTASATVITPTLLFTYKSVLLQIADSTLYSADRQVQFPCNGTDCRITGSFFVCTIFQVQIYRHSLMGQFCFIYFSVICHA